MTNEVKTRTRGEDLNSFALPGTVINNKAGKEIQLAGVPWNKTKLFGFRRFLYTWNGFEVPEYNLYDIAAAEDGDGIIKQSILKKATLMFKEGWSLSGQNEKTLNYVKSRLVQLSIASNKPVETIFRELGTDLIRYSNAFLLKVRQDKNSGGNKRVAYGSGGRRKNLSPVAAYFRMPAETLRIKVDDNGTPTDYMQLMPDGRRQSFSSDNVSHFYFNRRGGFNFAAPMLMTAVEDVRSLRRMEEYVEILVEQYIYPILTLTLGTDAQPVDIYEDGTSEVDIWQQKIGELDPSAGLVLSHRMKLETVTPGNTLPIQDYLNYFKQRIYTSCGVSPVDMGESSDGKANSDNSSRQLIDDVKGYQQSLADLINFEVINELLLERFDSSCLTEENIVRLQFNEIDIASKMKIENHNVLMHTMNGLTEGEMRGANKWNQLKDDQRNGLYLNSYEIPKIEAGGRVKSEMASTKGAAKSQSTNRAKPRNQHKDFISNAQLDIILQDFKPEDADFTKSRLSTWVLSLDETGNSADISLNNLVLIHNLVDDTVANCQEGIYTDELARGILKDLVLDITDNKENN